jgi:soluble lytic murein transglycosylase-like protein
MGRIRNTLVAAAIGAALTASSASASEAPPAPAQATEAPQEPASSTQVPAPVTPAPSFQQGATLTAPTPAPSTQKPAPKPAPQTSKPKPQPTGGTTAGKPGKQAEGPAAEEAAPGEQAEALVVPPPSSVLSIPSVPSSTCAAAGVPPVLIPIYQRAAAAYHLGPQGPAVLAGINEVETAFGTNLNVSSAGAVGWMQFMPSTWETYGVDANGDGVRDPYNPEDAIFAAASYLSAAGMPADTYGAIYSYNHADWYVAEVLANANCYAPAVGAQSVPVATQPQLQQLSCFPAKAWRRRIPTPYLDAFEAAAARYGLGRHGVWVLAGVARLESSFGRGMSKRELRTAGPLGLEPSEWRRYGVDGDGDGRIEHSSPADSAATLARQLWSRGSVRAGLFSHNQAEWYVQAVLDEAALIEGRCQVKYVDWKISLPKDAGQYVNPFAVSANLVTGRIDQGVDFTGEGAIVAIGDATVLATGAPGWPEEGGVLYQLTDGPLAGQVIFVYEGVDAVVEAGQQVKAGQPIATFRPGGSIEMGFADTAGVPLSHGEYYEGKVTTSGLEMFSLLQTLGV